MQDEYMYHDGSNIFMMYVKHAWYDLWMDACILYYGYDERMDICMWLMICVCLMRNDHKCICVYGVIHVMI